MATLAQLAQQYLNQGLPSISGIFQPRVNTPVEEPVEETIPGITPLFFQQMGGGEGGGGGPYNINPNDPNVRTSRNYVNPFPYDPMDDFGTPDYGYIDPPKEGLAGLFETYVKGSPLMRLAGKGLDALGNMIPPNRAGILQNELLGGGFMLDNTGRIVTNNYNTPEGIMAGYNPVSGGLLNLVTGGKMGEETNYGLDKSYDKRRERIAKTLRTKYRDQLSDEDIEAALAGEYEGDMPINPATGLPTDLINRIDLLNKSQNLFNKRKNAADIIFNRKVEERQQKALEKQRAAQAAAQAAQRQSDQSRINRAYREETGGQGGSYATGKSGVQKDGSYNDPFDPGGGE